MTLTEVAEKALAKAATPDPPVQVALARAAAAVGAIPKNDTNTDQGFKYRGIERILAGVGPALHRAGVVVLPRVTDVHREEMVRGARQTVWRLVTLTVEYTFVGPAGDHLTAVVLGEGLDNGDKAVSKAMTMAYKVALLQALQIADADTDPDASTPPEQEARQAPPAPPKPSRDDQERALAQQYDADHAKAAAALVKVIDALPDDKRSETKREFVSRFGSPWDLSPDDLPEARTWLMSTLVKEPA